MKKLSHFLFVLCISSAAQAQTSGWELGGSLSSGVSFQCFTPKTVKGNHKMGPGWSYSAGIHISKFFNNKYGIETGISCSSQGLYNSKHVFSQPYNVMEEPKPLTGQRNIRYYYLETPVRFVFKQQVGKVSLGCFAGISPAFLMAGYERLQTTMYQKNRGYMDGDARRFNLFADVGMLIRADITQRFSLDFRPYFRATVLPTYIKDIKDTSPYFEERFMSAGVTVNSVWKF